MSLSFATAAASFEMLGVGTYYLAFGVSFLESIAFVGLVIPSTTILIALGFLVSWGVLRIETLILAVALGGFLGDMTSFVLGKNGMRWFKPGNKIFKLEYLQKGESFFARHGAKSVFLARFLSPLRPIIPFVAGLFGMKRSRFLAYAAVGSVFSTVVYIGVGYGIGTLSDHSSVFLSHVERTLLIFGGITVAALIFRRFLVQQGEMLFKTVRTFMAAVFARILAWSFVATTLAHHKRVAAWFRERPHRAGLVFSGFGFLALAPFLIFLPWFSMWLESPAVQVIDISVLSQFYLWRTEGGVQIIRLITVLGSPLAIAGGGLFFVFWLLKNKQMRIAGVYMAVLGSASGFVAALKHLVARSRPTDYISAYHEHSASFPSFHAALTLTLLFLSTYFFISLSKVTWATKVNLWLCASGITLLIGCTRLYLGVHYLTDVFGGYMLGMAWFLLGIGADNILKHRYNLDKDHKND